MAEPSRFIYRRLDTVGDGTGAKSAIGDYSLAAQDFKITAPPAYQYEVARMIVSIEDTAGFQAAEYGNLGAALTNGVSVLVTNSSGDTILDLTDGAPVKSNAQWSSLCYDADLKTWGAGNELLAVRWTFTKAGEPILLKPGQSLVVRLNDDFSGLIGHVFEVQGLIV